VNLKAIAEKAVATGFSVAQSIVRSCTYKAVTPGTYNATTGTSTPTLASTPVAVIFGVLSQLQVDGQQVRVGDKKAVIKRAQLAAEPMEDDYILDGSVRLDVVKVFSEPTEAVWILAVREAKA